LIDNFYYIDPVECVKDIDCVSRILNMHREVFSLAIRNLYIINIDEELFRETVEKLLKLSKHSFSILSNLHQRF
jgi:CRISPR/Cas system-associated endonuclease Cas3-HD